jgi:hypothetical protein
LTGSVIAITCGLLGSFLILRKMAMVGDAISHAVLPGIVSRSLGSVAPAGPWCAVSSGTGGSGSEPRWGCSRRKSRPAVRVRSLMVLISPRYCHMARGRAAPGLLLVGPLVEDHRDSRRRQRRRRGGVEASGPASGPGRVGGKPGQGSVSCHLR